MPSVAEVFWGIIRSEEKLSGFFEERTGGAGADTWGLTKTPWRRNGAK